MDYSIVIPTCSRVDILPEVLAAVEGQREAPPFEVVVVDDGSTDATPEFLRSARPRIPFRTLRQANRGPAAARNAGVRAAQGRIVAFLGDDTVPVPGWLAEHDARRRGLQAPDRVAVVGYTAWHRRMRVTPLLDHLNENGLQFGYSLIRDPDALPYTFFYTSNLSVARDVLVRLPFPEDFPYPAFEDIAAGYRWATQADVRLVYAPAARVEHFHPTNFRRFAVRQEKAGYAAVVFYRLHPEVGDVLQLTSAGPPPLPSRVRQWFREWLVRLLEPLPVRMPKLWNRALDFHYVRGLHRGWEELMRRPGASPRP
jgi:glycosyltransferase involved in cell wall biosynthesis